jgi:hypothetical protein
MDQCGCTIGEKRLVLYFSFLSWEIVYQILLEKPIIYLVSLLMLVERPLAQVLVQRPLYPLIIRGRPVP